MRPPSDRIVLPERGLTLLPPWPQAIVFADKRLENRGASVAGHIGTWRGMVALTQSKKWDTKDVQDDADYLVIRGLIDDEAPRDWEATQKQWGCGVRPGGGRAGFDWRRPELKIMRECKL